VGETNEVKMCDECGYYSFERGMCPIHIDRVFHGTKACEKAVPLGTPPLCGNCGHTLLEVRVFTKIIKKADSRTLDTNQEVKLYCYECKAVATMGNEERSK